MSSGGKSRKGERVFWMSEPRLGGGGRKGETEYSRARKDEKLFTETTFPGASCVNHRAKELAGAVVIGTGLLATPIAITMEVFEMMSEPRLGGGGVGRAKRI